MMMQRLNGGRRFSCGAGVSTSTWRTALTWQGIAFFAFVMAVPVTQSTAGFIQNGDFEGTDDDFDDSWIPFGNVELASEGSNQFARFSVTKPSGFLGDVGEILQDFDLPVGAHQLSFDFRMVAESEDSGGSPFAPFDAFTASLFDENFYAVLGSSGFDAFFRRDAEVAQGGPDPPEFFDSSITTVQELGNGWRRVRTNLPELPAQELTVEFVLTGYDDGWSTQLDLDNVRITKSVVPEPTSCGIWLIGGLVAAAIGRRRFRSPGISTAA